MLITYLVERYLLHILIETIIRLPTNPQRGRNAYVRQFDNVPMDSL